MSSAVWTCRADPFTVSVMEGMSALLGGRAAIISRLLFGVVSFLRLAPVAVFSASDPLSCHSAAADRSVSGFTTAAPMWQRRAAATAQAGPSPQSSFRTAPLEDPARPASLRTMKQKEAIVATTQEAVQISAIVPTLTVDDLQKSISFYEALGFAIDERWEEKGTLLGVMLRAGGTRIGLNQARRTKRDATARRELGVRLSISTTPGQKVDEIAKRARNAGSTLKSDPHDT